MPGGHQMHGHDEGKRKHSLNSIRFLFNDFYYVFRENKKIINLLENKIIHKNS